MRSFVDPALREKARQARASRVVERTRSKLRRNFHRDDALSWENLARLNNLHLAPWGEPITTGAMESWLRDVGVSTRDYLEWDGDTRLAQFSERNPDWPLRAWQGLILEQWAKVRE